MEQHVPTLEIFYGISSPWAYMGALRAYAIAERTGATLKLRPIRIIETNGGIPLRSRPEPRQKYHEVELQRWSHHLDIALNLKPRYYPCRTIEPAAQAVIAVLQTGGDARAFSYAIQRALWAEDKDIADLDTLRQIAHNCLGSEAEQLIRFPQTESVQAEWQANLARAEELGIFGTPTYVIEDELFWGQDRLDFVERRLLDMEAQSGTLCAED
jgi:2-hydroxychromene-2-carboxylate isomerase